MKKIYFLFFLLYSINIYSSVSLEEKINFILEAELGDQITNTIKESSLESLAYSGLTSEQLDAVKEITEPYLDTFTKEIKEDVKILYKETFSDEEIDAYYNFLNSKPGKSFSNKMPQFLVNMMDTMLSRLLEVMGQIEEDLDKHNYTNPLIDADMEDIKTTNSCLYCDLDFQSFRGLNLDGVNLSGSKLQGADFTNSSLIGANFTDTYLVDTIFTGSILTGSRFTDAFMESSDFTDAVLDTEDLFEADYICNVKLSSDIKNIDC